MRKLLFLYLITRKACQNSVSEVQKIVVSGGKPESSPGEVTRQLNTWSVGNRDALDKLLPLVYNELRRLAHSYLTKERSDHTLQTTALVHEAYLKLTEQRLVNWENRAQFFAISAQAMRRILLDNARRRSAGKRGSGSQKVSLEELPDLAAESADESLIALDAALQKFEEVDPQQSRIVELRYFAGLTIEETAELLNISPSSVQREWASARAWLYKFVTGSPEPSADSK